MVKEVNITEHLLRWSACYCDRVSMWHKVLLCTVPSQRCGLGCWLLRGQCTHIDYLTSMVWSPRTQIWWNLIHRLIRVCRSVRGRAVWHHDYPPTVISPHMITLRVVVCKPCNSNCWGDFSAFPWWVALISAGWVNSWGALWNIHGIYYKCMDVKQQKMKIRNMRVCVYKVQTVENYKTTFKCRRFLIPPSLFGIKW